MKTLSKVFAIVVVLGLVFGFAPIADVNAATLDVCPTCIYTTIQAAIAAAASGDTINVAAGTYTETGQIVIDKDLTIRGANQYLTTVKPAQDTGSSGDDRGWFLVKTGVTFNLGNLTLNGAGFNVYQAIRHYGSGTINNLGITNISYPSYFGVGVAIMGGVVDVIFTDFSNIGRIGVIYFGAGTTGTFRYNEYTGKGDGDWLDYGVEVGGGAVATIRENVFTDCTGVASSDGSTSAGVMVTTYYGAGSGAVIYDNTFEDNSTAIAVGYNASDTSTVSAYDNKFIDNDFGISSTAPAVDADSNYWGTAVYSEVEAQVDTPAVTFDPYWVDEGMTILSNVAPAAVYVDDSFVFPDCGTHICGYDAFTTVEEGVAAVATGGTVNVADGTYSISSTIVVDKAVTITGPDTGVAKLEGIGVTAADLSIFDIRSGNVTLQKLDITHQGLPLFGAFPWVELDWSLIKISPLNSGLTGITITQNNIYVPGQSGAMSTWGGIALTAAGGSVSGINITGNTVYNTRNGIVLHYNNTATITGNTIYNTKGGIMNYTNTQADADGRVMTGNTWNNTHSEWDIVWNSAYYVPDYQASVLALSVANNNGYVLDRRAVDAAAVAALTGNRSHIFVDDDGLITAANPAKGNFNEPFKTIQLGIDAVVSGGTIYVADGTYVENPATTTTMNKSINMIGEKDIDGNPLPIIQGTLSLDNSLMTESNLVENFVLQQVGATDSVVLTQINGITVRNVDFIGSDNGIIEGRAIQMNGGSNGMDDVVIDDCSFTNGYYVSVQGSVKDITVTDSVFSGVKSGLNLQGGESNLVVDGSSFSVIAQGVASDTYGIRLGSSTVGTAKQLAITDSSFLVDRNGFVADAGTYHAAVIMRAGVNGVTSTIHNSTILGEVVNESPTTLDATLNWWGQASGPADGIIRPMSTGAILYCPWLDAEGGVAAYPVTNERTGAGYCSIQAAHDAAIAGDTIIVADGTYTVATEPIAPVGLVNIYKQITIKAADDENGIRPVIDATGRDGVFKIHANALTGGEIVIQGFDITGDYSTGVAITALYCGGDPATKVVIEDNLVHGMLSGFDSWRWTGCATGTEYVHSGIEIRDNKFYDLGIDGAEKVFGVVLEGLSDWATAGGKYAAIVEGNEFKDFIDGTAFPAIGVGLQGGAANARIANNSFPTLVSYDVAILAADVADTKIVYNDFGDQSGFGVFVQNITNGPVNATNNWWGSVTGPGHDSNPGGTGDVITDNVNYCNWLNAAPPAGVPVPGGLVTNTNTAKTYCSIQAAINDTATLNGHTLEVSPGDYIENVTVNKELKLMGVGDLYKAVVTGMWTIDASNVTVDSLKLTNPNQSYGMQIKSTAAHIDITNNLFEAIGSPTLNANVKGIYLLYGPDDVLIKGNTFKDIHAGTSSVNAIFSGDSNSVSPAEGLVIQDNIFEDITSSTKGGYGILLNNGAGNPGAVIANNTFTNISGGWTHAIGLEGPTLNAVVTGNEFSGLTALGPDNAAVFFEDNPAGASVKVEDNFFNNIGFGVGIAGNDLLTLGYVVDASPNWWGSACGPTEGYANVFPNVTFSPWYVDQTGTLSGAPTTYTFPAGTSTATMNAAIACAVPGSTFEFESGDHFGDLVVPMGRTNMTFLLKDGAVINANSPCFTVSADYTTITAQTNSMAACLPSGGSNGIDVSAYVRNVTIDGLEIRGKDMADVDLVTGDGIHFAGVVIDTVLVDNFIHDLDGNGIFFGAQPVALTPGAIDIHGNMFRDNSGKGIEAGTAIIPAEFNSWGSLAGPTAGDGISAGVLAVPWTHIDLSLASSGTPWMNQVVNGSTITYTVKANLWNVNAADFTLYYPANLTYVSATPSGTFGLTETITHNSTARSLNFMAYSTTGNVTPAVNPVDLFSVTFTANAVGTGALNLDDTTDGYGMSAAGSSSNVYGYELVDGAVDVVDLPTMNIVPLASPCIAGLPCGFQLQVTNPLTGLTPSTPWEVNFTLPSGAVLEFDNEGTWEVVTNPWELGALLPDGVMVTPTFRVTFVDPGANVLSAVLMDPAPDPDAQLASDSETFNALGDFALTGTFSMQGRSSRAGVPVTLTWAGTLAPYAPLGTTINQISNNLAMTLQYGGTYTITTNQPRYLNIPATLGKTVDVSGNRVLAGVELKGGNAVWTNNLIDAADAVEVGGMFGSGTIADDADVNFDNVVNVQDLALVGGNFDLASEDGVNGFGDPVSGVYNSWVP